MREQDGVLIERSVNRDDLEWPPEAELAEERSFNRTYQDLRGFTWDEANTLSPALMFANHFANVPTGTW